MTYKQCDATSSSDVAIVLVVTLTDSLFLYSRNIIHHHINRVQTALKKAYLEGEVATINSVVNIIILHLSGVSLELCTQAFSSCCLLLLYGCNIIIVTTNMYVSIMHFSTPLLLVCPHVPHSRAFCTPSLSLSLCQVYLLYTIGCTK